MNNTYFEHKIKYDHCSEALKKPTGILFIKIKYRVLEF